MILFPPEIINDTTESLFVKRTVRSQAIYLVVVVTIISALTAMPFIYVNVTTQARGIIRTPNENNPIQSAVYGEVKESRMFENKQVCKDDTLLLLNAGNIEEQIRRNQQKIVEDSSFITDIDALMTGREQLITTKYMTEHQYFHSMTKEQQTNIDYLLQEYQTTKTLFEKSVSPRNNTCSERILMKLLPVSWPI
jgi:HlyD family secretion protein